MAATSPLRAAGSFNMARWLSLSKTASAYSIRLTTRCPTFRLIFFFSYEELMHFSCQILRDTVMGLSGMLEYWLRDYYLLSEILCGVRIGWQNDEPEIPPQNDRER